MIKYLIAALAGYPLGCIQPSYILTWILKKKDIRTMGSGNAGASNTVSMLGWRFGIFVALFDMLKAAAAVWIVKALLRDLHDADQLLLCAFLAGFFAIIGHNHPIYMRFRGGKGTASFIGMLIAIDIRLALISAAVIILITVLTDYIALGAIGMVIVAAIFTGLFGYPMWCVAIMALLAILSILNHIPNFKRIFRGTENGLRKAFKKR